MEPWQFPSIDSIKTDTDTSVWPPVFQNYESYREELHEAIRLHPPFGEWLRGSPSFDYRWNHAENDKRANACAAFLTVEQLKEQYTKDRAIRNTATHASREILETAINILSCCDALQKEKELGQEKLEAYKIALEQYQKAKKGGYKIPLPREPDMPLTTQLAILRERLNAPPLSR